MQVNLLAKNPYFKGSFAIFNYDDYLPECDNNPTRKPLNYSSKTMKEVCQDTFESERKTRMKEISCTYKGVENYGLMWECERDRILDIIPENIKNLCTFHGIDITSELFMCGGLNAQNERFIVFNSFFKDQAVDESCEQLFCLKSKDENLTPLQKEIIMLFNTPHCIKYLKLDSIDNPLAGAGKAEVRTNEILVPGISALGSIAKKNDINDLINEKGSPKLVRYGAKDTKPNYLTLFF